MALRPKLELRQTQQLTMTPQLRQAIGMLAMSGPELSAFLADEAERNPLIAMSEPGGASPEVARPAPVEKLAPLDATMRRNDIAAGEAQFTLGRENLHESADAVFPRASRGLGGGVSGAVDALGRAVAPISLAEHLGAQIGLMRLSPEVRAVALALTGEVDEAGYLRVTPAEAAARFSVSEAVAEAAFEGVRRCEPTGVGARDLADCLALQLAERGRLDPAMRALLDDLGGLLDNPAERVAARCGVDAEDLADMLAEIRRLDPRPGLAFGAPPTDPAAPDILVSPDGAGGWNVSLNPATAPRILIDRRYAARIGAGRDGEAQLFLTECAQTASWLTRSLDQRARSLTAVAAEIARAQAGFFARGLPGLVPMTLRDVADAVDLHESTVSRVVANKLMATPRGVFDLRFFFSTALPSAAPDGAAHSATAVRARIRDLVAAEPAAKPLSDDKLVKLLAAEGVEVARRTVAKYREHLGIGSSVERRRRAAAVV